MSDTPTQSRKTPVFIHLPKTAGTFVRKVLEQQYPAVGCAYPTPPFKPLAEMDEAELAALRASPVVIGHESLHAFEQVFEGRAQYFTILRNPVDRLISYYNHTMTYSDRFKIQKLTPLRFLEQKANYELDNLQLRYLSGKPVREPVNREDLDRVKEMVLSGRIAVGIQERLAQAIRRLDIFRGADIAGMKPENVSVFGFSRASMTEAEIDAFRKRSALDMNLYGFCLKHFDGVLPNAEPPVSQAKASRPKPPRNAAAREAHKKAR